MARRRAKRLIGKWFGRSLTALFAVPALYLVAALIGSIIATNPHWKEPRQGTSIYIADNGIHADIIMPVRAQGLDWTKQLPQHDFANVPAETRWIAFGSGERHVYLDTPSWWHIRPRTILAALAGGPRVIHVEYVPDPSYAVRELRLRPEEYRRLWAAIRSDFALSTGGTPRRLHHAGYGPRDGFYAGNGKSNALATCNVAVARWLRLAGVKTSVWAPFAQGLIWRYRELRS